VCLGGPTPPPEPADGPYRAEQQRPEVLLPKHELGLESADKSQRLLPARRRADDLEAVCGLDDVRGRAAKQLVVVHR
jgi:hypothetical protein